MGIPNLTSFVEDKRAWNCVPISSIKRLVIDGSNLCHKLYYQNGLEWTHGGDYLGFYKAVSTFFTKLKGLDVDFDVILDGIDYKNEKTTTVRQRRENTYKQIRQHQRGRTVSEESVLPLLAKLVFMDALQDANVPFHVVDGDADPEIVAVANFHGCPVLAGDSDFYIFNIKGGYIKLQHFFEALKKIEDTTMVGVYNVTSFAEQFKLQDLDLRFLIPAILGNDFLKPVPYPGLHSPQAIIDSINCHPTVKGLLDSLKDRALRKHIDDNLTKVVVLYNVKRLQNPKELSKVNKLHLSECILDQYRKGCFASQMVSAIVTRKCILPPVVDDIMSESSHCISLRIRQYIYGILIQQPVQEFMRDKAVTDLTCRTIEPLMLKPHLTLDETSDLNATEATQILCSVLYCYKILGHIQELPGEWRLVAASCIYWCRKANPTPPCCLVKALVQSLIVCHDPLCESQEFAHDQSDQCFLETLHAFAQWQCTYYDAVALNQLLQEPFQYTSPANLYSGRVAMHCASLCLQSRSYQLDPDQTELFDRLMELIRLGSKHGTIATVHKGDKATSGPGVTQAEPFTHQNPFERLQRHSHSKKKKK